MIYQATGLLFHLRLVRSVSCHSNDADSGEESAKKLQSRRASHVRSMSVQVVVVHRLTMRYRFGIVRPNPTSRLPKDIQSNQ